MAMGNVMPLALYIGEDADVSARPARRAIVRDIIAASILERERVCVCDSDAESHN